MQVSYLIFFNLKLDKKALKNPLLLSFCVNSKLRTGFCRQIQLNVEKNFLQLCF